MRFNLYGFIYYLGNESWHELTYSYQTDNATQGRKFMRSAGFSICRQVMTLDFR